MPPLTDKDDIVIFGTLGIVAIIAGLAGSIYTTNEKRIEQYINGPPAIGIGKIDLNPAQTEIVGRKMLYYDKLSRCVTQEASIGWGANRYFDTDYSGNLDTRVSYTLVRGLGAVPTKRTTIAEHPELFTDVNLRYQRMIAQSKARESAK